MLLTITTTHQPATDLGYLLHKNPAKLHSFEMSFGNAHVFYPEATKERCTAALLLDVDAVGLVRNRKGPGGEGGLLDQYVNDRPYASSSFLSVAIVKAFGTAMGGRSKDRQELADTAIPLEARLTALYCSSGGDMLRQLFEPLGYEVEFENQLLDERFPSWGISRHYNVTLRQTVKLANLLRHLYVLIPVLDDEKHYWVSKDEVEKLLSKGEGWLATHPEKELITNRYLSRQRHLAREALARLTAEETPDPEESAEAHGKQEEAIEKPIRLNDQRMDAVLNALKSSGAKSVIDLGCGEGRLLRMLIKDKQFERIAGTDVSVRSLQVASERLKLERLPERVRERLELFQGSLIYRDKRLEDFDAAACVEVIEHLDPPRLAAFERVVFEFARPKNVVITTPNAEYNVKFSTLPAGRFRHKDHRFEWSREEFQQWALSVAQRSGYEVEFTPIGEQDEAVGSPTQMGVFKRA